MLEVGVFALVMVVLSVLGVVYDFVSGLIFNGVDGIFLLLVCLMIGAVFAFQLLYLGYERRHKAASSAGK